MEEDSLPPDHPYGCPAAVCRCDFGISGSGYAFPHTSTSRAARYEQFVQRISIGMIHLRSRSVRSHLCRGSPCIVLHRAASVEMCRGRIDGRVSLDVLSFAGT